MHSRHHTLGFSATAVALNAPVYEITLVTKMHNYHPLIPLVRPFFPNIFVLSTNAMSTFPLSYQSISRLSSHHHMSTVSLKQSTPLPFRYPSTPSGVACRRGFATSRFADCVAPSADESVTSVTRTRPAVLIDSMRAGASD